MSATTDSRSLRVVQWGCGLMGQLLIRYLHEKGATLVGAIDRDAALIGRDAGEISSLNRPLGVTIRAPEEAEQLLAQTRADACIVTTRSHLDELYAPLATCARHGVNAITTCEEAFFPLTTDADTTRKLHALALAHDCTLTGSGYQDVFWGYLITALAGATHRITRITGLTQYNVDDYGIALAEKHGAGQTAADFEATTARQDTPSYVWNSNEWLCAHFGWTISRMQQTLVPTTADLPVASRCLGKDIAPGHATGMRAVVVTETVEGPIIETHCIGKVYAPGEVDLNEWTLRGEPDTTVTIRQPATPELTCATIVNRLPQLISAPPGFVTTDRLGPPGYLTRPLHLDR